MPGCGTNTGSEWHQRSVLGVHSQRYPAGLGRRALRRIEQCQREHLRKRHHAGKIWSAFEGCSRTCDLYSRDRTASSDCTHQEHRRVLGLPVLCRIARVELQTILNPLPDKLCSLCVVPATDERTDHIRCCVSSCGAFATAR